MTISRNSALRDIVSDNPTAKVMLAAALHESNGIDAASAADSIESQLDPLLLSEIEQETFKRGEAKLKGLGRAEPQAMPSLLTNLRVSADNAPVLHIDQMTAPWKRRNTEFRMAEAVRCACP